MSATINGVTVSNSRLVIGYEPILDILPNSTIAYSLRKLRSGYTGKCVRIRRSNDDAEQDIGFINNELDKNSIFSFIGNQNIFQYSEDFSNAYWTKTRATVTINTNETTDPFGNNNATKILTNSANVNGTIITASNLSTITGIFCFSIYAKKGNSIYICISLTDATNSQQYSQWFDINSGRIGSESGNLLWNERQVSIENVGNNWYRCSITGVRTSTNQLSCIILTDQNNDLSNQSTLNNYTYIFGAQLNTSQIQTYTKTTSSNINPSCFVTKWYDQSGNNVDATQTTLANQPLILKDYQIQYINKNPTIFFDNTNDNLNITNSTAIDLQIKTLTSVCKCNLDKDFIGVYDKWIGGSPSTGYMLDFSSSTNRGKPRLVSAGSTSAGTSIISTVNVNNIYSLISAIIDSSNSSLSVNGIKTTGTLNTSSGNSANLVLNGDGASTNRGNLYLQEFIMWNSSQDNKLNILNSNINSYYNIY